MNGVFQELFGHEGMADAAQANFLRQSSQQADQRRRMNAQVDALLRRQHGDAYKPPDEDMGDVILNNVVTDPRTLEKLIAKQQHQNHDHGGHGHSGGGSHSRHGWMPWALLLTGILLSGLLGAILATLWTQSWQPPAPPPEPTPSLEIVRTA